MRTIIVLSLLSTSLLFMSGCRTLGDVRAAKGEGMTRVYHASEDQVWRVLPKAVNEVDLSVAGMYREDGYLLAERGVTMFSWGEKVAVFVEPQGANTTRVEVVSKRAVATNITAADFRIRLLDMIGRMLSMD
jgi:hypothetical protein